MNVLKIVANKPIEGDIVKNVVHLSENTKIDSLRLRKEGIEVMAFLKVLDSSIIDNPFTLPIDDILS